MKKIAVAVAVILLLAGPGFAGTVFLRGSGGGAGRTYLVENDFEAATTWDFTAGTSDCALDTNGDYCGQYASIKHQGSYSAGVQGDAATYMGISFTAQGEFYADWWYYLDTGRGTYEIAFYASGNSAYTVSFYYNSTIKIYNNGGTTITTTYQPPLNTWVHFRLYVKRDTDDTDGIIKLWYSTTDTDFDGDAPNESWTNVNTADNDTGVARLRGNSTSTTYRAFYDQLLIWVPDGNE